MEMFPHITVIVPYEDEKDGQEAFEGVLTSEQHAIYVEKKYGNIIFAGVVPARVDGEFIVITRYLALGKIGDWDDRFAVIAAMTLLLKRMTAYQFLTDVILHISKTDVEFDNLIIDLLL